MPNIFTPSPQQAVVYDWVLNGTGSAQVSAVAGSGKTTTLIKALELMSGSIFFGSFNKKIAEEIAARAPKNKIGLDIGTMHSVGFGFWRKAAPGVKLNVDKCRDIFRTASEKHIEYKRFESIVLKLVSLAKQAAVGIEQPMDQKSTWIALVEAHDIETFDEDTGIDNSTLIIGLARKVLQASIDQDMKFVDFDDMIYAPLVHNIKTFQYDWVLIDEAQDTNAARRLLALKMLKSTGRLLSVGDPRQAIYRFAGADADAFALIATATNAKELPLTVSYRCPKSVVAYAQQWVSHIQAADNAPEGIVSEGLAENLINLAVPGDAVICRFNAPLLKNVYKFIAAGIPAKVEGREIGAGLKALAQRWKVKSIHALLERLDSYVERETAKLEAKEKTAQIGALNDKVECLRVIINRVQLLDPNTKNPTERVCKEIDNIFVDDANSKVVIFSSIHRSKGREFHKVIWLQTGPSPYAKKPEDILQEENLCYVAATRAQRELCLVQITKD